MFRALLIAAITIMASTLPGVNYKTVPCRWVAG